MNRGISSGVDEPSTAEARVELGLFYYEVQVSFSGLSSLRCKCWLRRILVSDHRLI